MSDFDEYRGKEVFLLLDARVYATIEPRLKLNTDFLEIYATVKSEKGDFVNLEQIVIAMGDHWKRQFDKAKINKKYIISVFSKDIKGDC